MRQVYPEALIHSSEARQSKRRGRDRVGGDTELGEGFGDKEGGRAHPVAGVGFAAGGSLGVDQVCRNLRVHRQAAQPCVQSAASRVVRCALVTSIG